jgi:hypothetical protein
LTVVKWNDNSAVIVASNTLPVFPSGSAKRFSRKERKDLTIPQPLVIGDYNKHMDGVDPYNNSNANYRIKIRGKK